MSLRWIAKRLRMGTASSLANLLRREEENQQYVEVRRPVYVGVHDEFSWPLSKERLEPS